MEPTLTPAPAGNDEAIAESLRAFVCALGASAANVRLDCRAGVVTLTGAVASETHRQAIEDLVRAHDGVTAVTSEVQIRTPGVIVSGF